MKKIFFIISSLQSLGGTERVVATLANHLCKVYDITILSQDLNIKDNAYPLDPSIKDIKSPKGSLNFILHIKKHIKYENPDFVVIHTMSKLTPILLLSGITARRLWSMEHISYEFHNKLFQQLRVLLYSKLDKVLVFTENQKEIYANFSTNVDIIKNPSPLDINNKAYNKDSKTIISIGRLTYQKGYDILIKSWAEIERSHPNWSLNIYGEGEDKKDLIRLIKKYSLKNIHLKGQTFDICSIYDSASFYVMSSRYEGLPMVLIEAQSRGLPIVSFDCPTGPNEIVKNGVNGILTPPNDYVCLSKNIDTLIKNPSIRSKMSTKSLELSKQFLTSEVAKSWINYFESSIE